MARAVHEVRETNPLAPSITNTVTQNFVANAQLAVGGSAAMVYLPDEGECVAALGGAVYINLGTLLPVYEQTVPATARACAAAGKPWVLDPVGIGIGSLRTQLIEAVHENPPAILRGNASEIIAVAELWGLAGDSSDDASGDGPRGVDSTDSVDAAERAAVACARFTGGAVAVSGATDLVTDGVQVARLAGLPDDVIARAKELLKQLEAADINHDIEPVLSGGEDQQMSLFGSCAADDIIGTLSDMQLDTMTPMDAMNALYDLQMRAKLRKGKK